MVDLRHQPLEEMPARLGGYADRIRLGKETVRATSFRAWACGPKASQAQTVTKRESCCG